MPTADEIEQAKSPNGGWDKAKLAEWGIPWPPTAGWQRVLAERERCAKIAENLNYYSGREIAAAIRSGK